MTIEKVLLIDDDADVRLLVRTALEALGPWSVVEAATGEEGLRLAAEERPDVVLLDLMMPLLDGPATLERLRAQPAGATVPVILLTAKRLAPGPQAHGTAGTITKPFDPMKLCDEIRRLVGASDHPS